MKYGSNSKRVPQASNLAQIVRGHHRHEIWVKWQGGTTGMKFGSNGKGGPQASNFRQIVRGTTGMKFRSNSKGGPQEIWVIKFWSNSKRGDHRHEIWAQIVRGDHRHEIWVK